MKTSVNKLYEEVSSKLSMLDSKRKTINRCKGSKEVGKKNIGNYDNVRFQRKENGKVSYMVQCSKKSYEGSEYCWKHDNSGKTIDFTTLEKVVESITKAKESVEKKVKSHEPNTLRIIVSKELRNRLAGINIRIEKQEDTLEENSSPINFMESSLDLDPGDDSSPEAVIDDPLAKSEAADAVDAESEAADAEAVDAESEAAESEAVDAESDAAESEAAESEADDAADNSDTEEPVAESEDDEGLDVSGILTQDGEEYYLNDNTKVVYRLDDDGDGVEIGIFTNVSDKKAAFLYDGDYYAVFEKGTKCMITKRSYKKVKDRYICK